MPQPRTSAGTPPSPATRYLVPDLVAFACALLANAGLDAEKAQAVADILVEADLLGYSTHGLALLPPYLTAIEQGGMKKTGAPRVIRDLPAAVTWDGGLLPGPWLVQRALALASERARQHGVCAVVIRRSHHIACLAAYLRSVAQDGLVAILCTSDPHLACVAPHGGTRAVYTPNPIAAAWPAGGDPVILDVSTSITTIGMTQRLTAEGRKLPHTWVLDGSGHPSDDPSVLRADPPGALLPVGGLDHGHKGYALGLLMEALTGGLAGYGRAEDAKEWSANVFVQVFDPALFGGSEDFVRQTTWLAEACRAAPPREDFDRVRMPGEAALARRRAQLAGGIELYPGILRALEPWAVKLGVSLPAPGMTAQK